MPPFLCYNIIVTTCIAQTVIQRNLQMRKSKMQQLIQDYGNYANVFGRPVNLNDYKSIDTTINLDEGIHSHFGFRDLKSVRNTEYKNNFGVRAKQNIGRDAEDFMNELQSKGFSTNHKPAIVDVNTDDIVDGRKREAAFILGNQEFLPCEYRIYNNTSYTTKLSSSLLHNLHLPTVDRATPDDLGVTLQSLLTEGEIQQTAAAAHKYMSINLKGLPYQMFHKTSITRQLKKFLALSTDGQEFMKLMERKDAEKYAIEALQHDNFALYTPGAHNQTNIGRALAEHILPNAPSGKHTNIVLYIKTNPTNPVEATLYMKAFKTHLDNKLAMCGDLVERSLSGIQLKNKPFRPNCYTIVGCIPQKQKDDNHVRFWNAGELIDLSDY